MALWYYYMMTELMHEEDQKKCRRSQRQRRHRILREKFALNSIPDKEFVYKYRLSRELFNKLCEELTPLLPHEKRQHGPHPHLKLLAVLNFFAWGRLQTAMGKNFSTLSAPQSLSRCISEVTDALNHRSLIMKYLTFPQNKDERSIIKKRFQEKFGFPDVLGCIDCTHIAITKPVKHEAGYLNENNYYSIFPQVICDADHNILNVGSYGGASSHYDIWLCNPFSKYLDALQETTYLLGDINYLQGNRLMTPVIYGVTENSPESRYNEIHKAAHASISRTIYMLKARWRCLLAYKELQYDPSMASKIFMACCILHNMCNKAGIAAPELSERDIEEERKRQSEPRLGVSVGDKARMHLVRMFEENRAKL